MVSVYAINHDASHNWHIGYVGALELVSCHVTAGYYLLTAMLF